MIRFQFLWFVIVGFFVRLVLFLHLILGGFLVDALHFRFALVGISIDRLFYLRLIFSNFG